MTGSCATAPEPLLPGADAQGRPVTLGVMGGGQLGRMFVHAAQRLGYATAVLDPDATSPAGMVSHHHVQAGYEDAAGLRQLASVAGAITTEFENVPAPSMAALAAERPVSPGADALAIAQDRAREKAHFTASGVACAPYAAIETAAQLASVDDALLPGILKTSRLGYDGKGQARVRSRAELQSAWHAMGGVPCVLEQLVDLALECSVVLARGRDGTVVHFPVQRNVHHDGILALTEVFEGNVPAGIAAQAIRSATAIADSLQYVGILCVEFFVLRDGRLLANEMAPRPHNSGHYSIDACDQSQFDLQVHTLAGLPLVAPRQHSPAAMLNLMGDLWLPGPGTTVVTPDWAAVLALPGTHLHLYGKTAPRKARKMGHLTITAPDVASLRATTSRAAQVLGLPYAPANA